MIVEECYEDDEFCDERRTSEENLGELKCASTYSYGGVENDYNTSQGIAYVSAIRPGTGPYNRTGKAIRMKSLRIKGTVHRTHNNTTGFLPQGNTIRIVVILDRFPDGTFIHYNKVFSEVSIDGTESTILLSSLNPARTKRFKILKDFVKTVDRKTNVDVDVNTFDIDMYIDLKNIKSTFELNTPPLVQDEILYNAVYVFYKSTNYDATYNYFFLENVVHRLRYYDI